MIEAEDISKVYHVGSSEIRALDRVSLRIPDGEFVTIVGRSGSGKTTLLSILGGLTKPTSGTTKIDGRDLWALTDAELSSVRGEEIGFVFQFSGLIPTLTCIENVALPRLFVHDGPDVPDVMSRARNLLKYVGLSERADSYPSQLSGGELKRAAVARSVLNNPSVILADEPTSDLDVDTEQELMELLARLNGDSKTVVIVTHNPALSVYGKRFLRMDRGRLYEEER